MAYSELVKSFERIRSYMREFYVYGFKSRDQEKFDQHLWGVSTGPDHNLDHIEMTVHFDPGEEFVLHRLEREKRHGTVELLDSQTCRFSADVYDASEILPWLRTFIGRIVDLKCSSQYVLDMFQEDLARMDALYGGGNDVIQ